MSPSQDTTRVPRSTVFLFGVLFLGGVLRYLYAQSVPPTIAPDTYGYNSVGFRILSGQEPVMSDERPPVYPLLLATTAKFFGRSDDRLDTKAFQQTAALITFFQAFFGLATIILIYSLSASLGLPLGWGVLVSFLVGTNIMIFGWERQLLTESLATFLLTLVAYFGVKFSVKSASTVTWLLVITFTVAFLLKPVFLLLPMVYYPSVFWIFPKARRLSFLSLLCFLAVVTAYVVSNVYYYHYPGINHVTDVNALGKILTFRLPIPAGLESNPFTKPFVSYETRGGTPDPYLFLWSYDPTFLTRTNNIPELNQLREFTTFIVLSNFFSYLVTSIAEIPHALGATDPRLIPNSNAPFLPLWHGLFTVFAWLQKMFVLTLFLMPLTLLNKKVFLVGLLTFSFLLSTVVGGYGEFYRILSPLQPLLITLTVWCVYQTGVRMIKLANVLLSGTRKHGSEKWGVS